MGLLLNRRHSHQRTAWGIGSARCGDTHGDFAFCLGGTRKICDDQMSMHCAGWLPSDILTLRPSSLFLDFIDPLFYVIWDRQLPLSRQR